MNKRNIILGLAILLIVAIGFFASNTDKPSNSLPFIAANPGNPDEEFKFTEEQTAQYNEALQEALKYKSEGDAGKLDSYQKAIEFYAKAAEIGQGRVWVPYLNLGNVFRLIDDYETAEAAYNEGLKVASESLLYKAKIELHRYDFKKSPQEVIKLYEEALSKVVENVNLYSDYGFYLSQNGFYKEALPVFEELSNRFPENQSYKDEINSLKSKI